MHQRPSCHLVIPGLRFYKKMFSVLRSGGDIQQMLPELSSGDPGRRSWQRHHCRRRPCWYNWPPRPVPDDGMIVDRHPTSIQHHLDSCKAPGRLILLIGGTVCQGLACAFGCSLQSCVHLVPSAAQLYGHVVRPRHVCHSNRIWILSRHVGGFFTVYIEESFVSSVK